MKMENEHTQPAWVKRYVARLGQTVETPSKDYLARLMRAHLTTCAFENITKFQYFAESNQTGWFIPPIETFVHNMEEINAGGTCFTSNGSFVQLLQRLGFDAYLVKFQMEHCGIVVNLEEGLHYVDVGVGAPFFEPVPLEQEPQVTLYGSGVKFTRKADDPTTFLFHHLLHEETTMQWEFAPYQRVDFSAFSSAIERMNTPGSLFMSFLRCQLWQPDRSRNLSLSDNKLIIREPNDVETKILLSSVEEIERVIAEEFRLPKLPVREAIGILEGLGVDVFRVKET